MSASTFHPAERPGQTAQSVYILRMLDDRAWLIGPFADHAQAGAWGAANNPEDDPRWQTIELSPARADSPLPLLPPDRDMAAMAEVV